MLTAPYYVMTLCSETKYTVELQRYLYYLSATNTEILSQDRIYASILVKNDKVLLNFD